MFVAWLLVPPGSASGTQGSAPCTESESCRGELELSTGGTVYLYRSLPLGRTLPVKRAVVVIHGNRRDGDRYFERLVDAASVEGRLQDVLLLAPNFRALKDGPAPREHFWSSSGWKIGNRSRDPARISSFSVLDELLEHVCPANARKLPQLDSVVIIGHSAGGQFVNRYLAGGRGCPDPDVEVRYVAMNPSSYLYVDARRRSSGVESFGIPETHCSEYDDYKYGLRDMNAYMSRVGRERIRANLFTRRSYYLAGEQDVKLRGSLDQSCPAMLQGPQRLQRHSNYRSYRALFEGWSGAVFRTVPGVAHSGRKMLMSETAREITFR